MAPAKSVRPVRLLTESELELMTILWRLRGGTVADVLAALPSDRPLAYTSVSTILRILEQKGVLTTEKVGRGHRYLPAVAKGDYETVCARIKSSTRCSTASRCRWCAASSIPRASPARTWRRSRRMLDDKERPRPMTRMPQRQ